VATDKVFLSRFIFIFFPLCA